MIALQRTPIWSVIALVIPAVCGCSLLTDDSFRPASSIRFPKQTDAQPTVATKKVGAVAKEPVANEIVIGNPREVVYRGQSDSYGGTRPSSVSPDDGTAGGNNSRRINDRGTVGDGYYADTSYYQDGPPLPRNPNPPTTIGGPNQFGAVGMEIAPSVDSVGSSFPFDGYFRDIQVDVMGTETGRIVLGAGLTSDAGFVGNFVIDEQNFDITRFPTSFSDLPNAFRGRGQRFRFEAMPGNFVERYLVNFSDPYFLDTHVSFGVSGFFYDRRFFDWDERREGGRVTLGYQFPNDWSTSVALRYENVEVHNPRIVPVVPELAAVLGNNDNYGVRFVLRHDTRNSAFIPTSGHNMEVSFEQVFGSFQYPRAIVKASQYFKIRERGDGSGAHVLGINGTFGVSGDETPVYDNFFAGGASTMRGFSFRGASPKTGDVIVGGELQLLGAVEYIFPLTFNDMLRGVLFTDFGTVEKEVEIHSDSFRVAPGFGLRVAMQALGPAPIALDLAFPINEAVGDSTRTFTFSMSMFR